MKKIFNILTACSALACVTTFTSCSSSKTKDQYVTINFTCGSGGKIEQTSPLVVKKNTKWSQIKKPSVFEDEGFTQCGWYIGDDKIPNDFYLDNNITVCVKFAASTAISNFSFLFNKETKTAIVQNFLSKDVNDVYVPSTVKQDNIVYKVKGIYQLCFNEKKIKSLYLPNTIENISYNAFSECSELETVVLSNNIIALSSDAFKNCKKLKSIYLPSSIVTIEPGVFVGCNSLTEVIFENYLNESWIVNLDSIGQKIDVSDPINNSDALTIKCYKNYLWERKSDINFMNDTWANLGSVLDKGLDFAKEYYHINSFIGLQKNLIINGIPHKVIVVGESHDKIANSEKTASLTFSMCNAVSVNGDDACLQINWNESSLNLNYLESNLYKNLNSEQNVAWYTRKDEQNPSTVYTKSIASMIQDQYLGTPDLYPLIKTIDKEVSVSTLTTSKLVKYQTKLFVFTSSEVFSDSEISRPIEGRIYEYWEKHSTQNAHIIKDSHGTAQYYHLASRYPNNVDDVLYVDTIGKQSNAVADTKCAVVFGFCI